MQQPRIEVNESSHQVNNFDVVQNAVAVEAEANEKFWLLLLLWRLRLLLGWNM